MDSYTTASAALRREATAMERLCVQISWSLVTNDDPQLTPAVLRAVAELLDTLEPE